MASFTYPGVYIEELSSGQNTIAGVATSIGAFAGWAPQGPVTAATLVQSWPEYESQFGGLDSRSWLGYAVNQFFANGGDQCYIVRLVWDGTIPGGVNNPTACATALAAGVGYGTATITATSGALSAAISLGVGTPVLQSVTVLPQGMAAPAAGASLQLPPLPPGATLALSATGGFSDGSSSSNLPPVTWISSNPALLSVLPSGLVTAGSPASTATVTITASCGILTGSISLTVTAAAITAISVTPSLVNAVVGQNVQLAAAAKYADGTSPNITALANFTCSPASAVTFASTQTLSLQPGQFQAVAAAAGASISAGFPVAWTLPSPAPTAAPCTVNIAAAEVVSVAISPANATVPLNLSGAQTFPTNFGIAATLSNGSAGTVPAVAGTVSGLVWSSSNPQVATIDAPTVVTITAWSIASNVATFTAANSFTTGEAVVLSGFPTSTFFNGQTVNVLSSGLSATQFEVDFNHADGAATEAGTAIPSLGAITAWSIAAGVATFTAANSFAVGEAVVLSGFPTSTFFNGQVVTVLSTGLSGTQFEANFSSANGSATEAGFATPNLGAITVVGTGTATITASYTPPGASSAVTASTSFTVSPAHLTGLTVSPSTLSLAAGLSQQLTVTGTFDDGSFVDMTGCAVWSSSNANAGVSATGLVKGNTANQTAAITAAWMNLSPACVVTIVPAIPQSLAITTTPANTTSIAPGQNLSLVATATYSDGTTAPVTGTANWSSSAPSLLSTPGPGLVAASASAGGALTLFANSPGIWGNNLYVSISVTAGRFNLLLQQMGASGQLTTLESYVSLSVSPTDPSYVVTVINNDSNYITFTNPRTKQNVVPTATPAATASPVAFNGGIDGTVLHPTDQNFELALLSITNSSAGINLLDRVDIFNLLCVPGETDAPTISTLQAYCARKRAFMIVDSPQSTTISNMIQSGPVGSTPGSITGQYADSSALYFPWIQAPDPLAGNRPTLFPPCGFVAGIYAATDASRGVWKAPAGINAGFTGNSGLQFVLTDAENGSLNTQAVNCLRQFKVYGDVVWGARTLAGNDQAGSQWKYVPIRRLADFIESSLFDGTQWVVFEPNDETLWGQVRLNVGTFLQGLFLQGAFAGSTPQQAYFVKCDSENNPPASIALGVVTILVGFAPLYPAEFVVIQIQQIMAQAS